MRKLSLEEHNIQKRAARGTFTATINARAEKPCVSCGLDRPAGDFPRDKRTRDGAANSCNACEAVKCRAFVDARVAARVRKRTELFARTEKHCPGCQKTVAVEMFSRNKSKEDGLVSHCRPCQRAASKAKRDANGGVYAKAYYLKHRERMAPENRARARAYYAALPKELRVDPKPRYRALKSRALATLGGVCVRCGFTDERALQIDHIDGCGVVERVRTDVRTIYFRVSRGETAGFQILCANCNWIKRVENDEHLPMTHEKRKQRKVSGP